jgi:SAM-dependent methyltransferase
LLVENNLRENSMDALDNFKAMQKQGWAHFAPLEAITTIPAAELVKRARIQAGQHVLDVACGTGVVGVTAARLGAKVSGLDLTPELLDRARENSLIAGVVIDWHEGDAEKLPFNDAKFDAVLSQYGHMFAPRPEVAVKEMLRVLKPGGTIAFSTWPPDMFIGRMFAMVGRNMPPPPEGVAPPPLWGDPNIIKQRLGAAVKDVFFYEATMRVPALSPQHFRLHTERTAGPLVKLVEMLSAGDPAKLAAFREQYDALVSEYFDGNTVHQDFLITRATKV